ncbi:hypothetical protein P872_12555 [Rhodonellum psychrophilum GCM71 = DSM 17998]|uniref:Uncharacterized protein n=1 Tax=Rhodonellum psychrophilum GCM71 = DSM 17998 TaxID=1123057 RepID=U5BVL1_9BACT|nr:hypothetical protein P872_12555 [Rhodonellum psychrophilum GCM71 = DSM 17998]
MGLLECHVFFRIKFVQYVYFEKGNRGQNDSIPNFLSI